MAGAAFAATGISVASGIFLTSDEGAPVPDSTVTARTAAATDDVAGRSPRRVAPGDLDRTVRVSRSDRRTSVDEVKKAALDQDEGGQVTATEDLTSRDPRTVARALLGDFGFGSDQFSCLDSLYTRESGWNVHADNPSSSAYGIPQALPGSKMSSAGADWADNAETQIRWGLGYIKARYGTPCAAWGFQQGHNWY